MKVSEIGEFGLIERLKGILGSGLIGDDTAPVRLGNSLLLLTCDVLLQDRHFKLHYPPSAIGWKAISVNVSDVVANGGQPLYALVSLVLPDMELRYIEDVYLGIKRACEFYSCEVVGGNLSRGDKLCIDVFMLGKAERFVGRGGARAGDGVFVSGPLGDSRAGLELLLMERRSYEDFELRLMEKHLRPTARIDLLKHVSKYANASMDISDGLSSDAEKLSRASGVRLSFFSEKIPLSQELINFCKKHGKDPLEYALSGGEDYELLFTHPPERLNPFLSIVQIGFVEEGQGVFLDGKPLEPTGFDHFRVL
ncbi:MAG: thiamine-phosphate kinase [Aquificaceae bacterium]|jgi:thiamine-monophosphate kinase|uniref:thiamine-phosphate kinase n=1 Tax=Hydrogenobacter sp. Uz 6-8 TaxID=3384828 RepID=UPI00309ADBDD